MAIKQVRTSGPGDMLTSPSVSPPVVAAVVEIICQAYERSSSRLVGERAKH